MIREPAEAAVTARTRGATAPADAIRRLSRNVGNRATARLLQRWVDQDGKTYPGDKPADSDNWESYDHAGEQRWRPKTVAVATPVAVDTAVKPAAVPAATVVAVVAPVRNTTAPAINDSATVWWSNPATIRYTQNTISAKFTNGTAVDSAARSLKKTPAKIDEWPPLLLRKKGGKLMSLDNRRLWVFKHAGVPLCKVRWASDDEWKAQSWKFTASGAEGSAFIGVKGPPILDMKDLPTFTPPASFTRVLGAQYK